MDKGTEREIVVSTRVRLARNLAEYPFPGRQSPDQQQVVVDRVAGALAASPLGNQFRLLDLSALSETDRRAMVEKHLISQDLAEGKGIRSALINTGENVSIMINEEDHLRIQVLGEGLCLDSCLKKAVELDTIFDSLRYAYDEKLGYLTKCPTNLGIGMRASVMVHLPALTESGAIRNLAANAGKLGFTVRGLFGEGSQAKGALYQISNQMSLGFTEEAIVERLSDAIAQIIALEKRARLQALNQGKVQLEDRIWRAVGLMSFARTMTSDEAMKLLSDIRLGNAIGLVKVPIEDLNRLLWEIQPSNIMQSSKEETLTPEKRDRLRAELLHHLKVE